METEVKITKTEEEWAIVYNFAWELDETNADNTFEPMYEELKPHMWGKIIFDFKELKYINSKTIGYLVDIFSNTDEAGWKMYIRNCVWWIRDTLNFTWVDTIIPYID